MTPYDLLRSLAASRAGDKERDAVNAKPPAFFNMVDEDGNGLISWDEYLLMIVLISVFAADKPKNPSL